MYHVHVYPHTYMCAHMCNYIYTCMRMCLLSHWRDTCYTFRERGCRRKKVVVLGGMWSMGGEAVCHGEEFLAEWYDKLEFITFLLTVNY